MDDLEGGIQDFDFEQGLESGPSTTQPLKTVNGVIFDVASNLASSQTANTSFANQSTNNFRSQFRKNFRQTVCRHWLRGLCMKGNDCGFLHQFDKSRMPVCRFFAKWGECREPDCIYKHSNEDIKECNMYKLGFCPNGPECRYRHQKIPGPPPIPNQQLPRNPTRPPNLSTGIHEPQNGRHPHNEVFENDTMKIQPRTDTIDTASDFPHSAMHSNSNLNSNSNFHSSQLRTASEMDGSDSNLVHKNLNEKFVSQSQSQSQTNYFQNQNLLLPVGTSRYFIVKSNNIDNLELSAKRGLWATHKNNENKLNDALDHSDNVILIFSVNETRHFQGCAKMISRIGKLNNSGGWKCSNGISNYGKNFRIKWLKLCELSFNKTRHLRNPYNENLPVKISRDCQEVEPSIGFQLCELLFAESDSHFMEIANAAEKKLEELKSKGELELENESDENFIQPYQYNEQEEEEEEEDEEDDDEEEEDEEEDEDDDEVEKENKNNEKNDKNTQKGKKPKFQVASEADQATENLLGHHMNPNFMPPGSQPFNQNFNTRGQMFPFNQNFIRGPGMAPNFFPGLPEDSFPRNFPHNNFFRPENFPRPMNFRGSEIFNPGNGFPGPENSFGNVGFPMGGFLPVPHPQAWGMNFPGQVGSSGFRSGGGVGSHGGGMGEESMKEGNGNQNGFFGSGGSENGLGREKEQRGEESRLGMGKKEVGVDSKQHLSHEGNDDLMRKRRVDGYGEEQGSHGYDGTHEEGRERSDINSKFRRRRRFEENDEEEEEEGNR